MSGIYISRFAQPKDIHFSRYAWVIEFFVYGFNFCWWKLKAKKWEEKQTWEDDKESIFICHLFISMISSYFQCTYIKCLTFIMIMPVRFVYVFFIILVILICLIMQWVQFSEKEREMSQYSGNFNALPCACVEKVDSSKKKIFNTIMCPERITSKIT